MLRPKETVCLLTIIMASRTDSCAAPHELSKSMQRATYRKRRQCVIKMCGHPAGSSDDIRMAKAQCEKCTWLEDGLPIQKPGVTSHKCQEGHHDVISSCKLLRAQVVQAFGDSLYNLAPIWGSWLRAVGAAQGADYRCFEPFSQKPGSSSAPCASLSICPWHTAVQYYGETSVRSISRVQ